MNEVEKVYTVIDQHILGMEPHEVRKLARKFQRHMYDYAEFIEDLEYED